MASKITSYYKIYLHSACTRFNKAVSHTNTTVQYLGDAVNWKH
jgi:hypothetical protein